ncbi:Glycerol 2-dehydrogenase (NADP(+)) [Hypsizygus marmoreus]|uniref:Glycerol 2-dehydrogenase (NADP(+)) n=1 Tax=Hypsizygus marmoreus TaxID=39966 RepID=A0A369JYT6_HYPMA|nr:Glycerol 2-dehydrogenase (NADP(+)) [Hypsizygus marmoreus]
MVTATTVPWFTLNNGVKIPAIGHGAYAPAIEEAQSRVKDWILTALKAGYRHIDTAQGYGTERAVGEAIKASGIPREEIFITTKLQWNHQHIVAQTFEESLKALDVEYIDLFLIHWPQAVFYDKGNSFPKNPDGSLKVTDEVNFNQAWAELEKIYATGKVKAIGVSNFSIKTLEQLFTTAKIVPAVNQVELHPYLAQEDLREYSAKKGIILTAYTPSGYDTVRNDPLILSLATKYNATPTQVILAWHIARGVVVVPKSEREERQKENITLPELDAEDISKISALDRGKRLCNYPDEKGQVYGWTVEQLGW